MMLKDSKVAHGLLNLLSWRLGGGLNIPFQTTKCISSSALCNSFSNLYITTLYKNVSVGNNGAWLDGRQKWNIEWELLLENSECESEVIEMEELLMGVNLV